MPNEIFVYDEIGPRRWGLIDAKMIADALEQIGKENAVDVHFNSPGGSVFEAQAMAAAFDRHQGQITGYVDGVAASAASYLLQACDVRVMNRGTHQMVHGPWTMAAGNKIIFREVADKLEMFEAAIAERYAARWSGSGEDLQAVLEAEETWYTADEAVGAGLADSVSEAPAIAACLPAGLFNKVPAGLAADPRPAELRQRIAARRLAGDVTARRQWLDIRSGQLGLTPGGGRG